MHSTGDTSRSASLSLAVTWYTMRTLQISSQSVPLMRSIDLIWVLGASRAHLSQALKSSTVSPTHPSSSSLPQAPSTPKLSSGMSISDWRLIHLSYRRECLVKRSQLWLLSHLRPCRWQLALKRERYWRMTCATRYPSTHSPTTTSHRSSRLSITKLQERYLPQTKRS